MLACYFTNNIYRCLQKRGIYQFCKNAEQVNESISRGRVVGIIHLPIFTPELFLKTMCLLVPIGSHQSIYFYSQSVYVRPVRFTLVSVGTQITSISEPTGASKWELKK